ncbi:MAG: hypothetical protein K6G48_00995 [Acholeplasmatales bacterium]|nr:hypothetical protein [Acholeplasmatales bacterium]
MSEQVLLNRSFNEKVNKTTLITTKDDILLVINEDDKSKEEIEIKAADIKEINILNAKCPSPIKRAISYIIGFIAVIFFVLGIVFKDNAILLTIFAILGILIFVLSGILAKYYLRNAPDAIQIVIFKSNKRINILGVNTTSKDYKSLLRIARSIKKLNDNIKLDMQSRK